MENKQYATMPPNLRPIRSTAAKDLVMPVWSDDMIAGKDEHTADAIRLNFRMEEKRAETLKELHKGDDVQLSCGELCAKYGYPYETFFVETADGFLLQAFRISGPKGSSPVDIYKQQKKPPVIVYQHGLLDSSDGLLCNGKDSLAFTFADTGYDVWMTNSRGNRYGKNHRFMDENDPEFWKFSLQEMGELDVPANVDFILKTTGQAKLTYMGHSQGTAQMFGALCDNCDYYKDKVNLFIAVAPVARVGKANGKHIEKVAHNDLLVSMLEGVGPEIMPMPNIDNTLKKLFFKITNLDDFGLGEFSDADASKIGELAKLNYQGHYPCGASFQSIDHFKQLVRSDEFVHYDFGEKINMKKYGQKTAPIYDIAKIRHVPIALFCGTLDLLASPTDYNWLKDELQKTGCLAHFSEHEVGHLGLLMPADPAHLATIVEVANKHNGK